MKVVFNHIGDLKSVFSTNIDCIVTKIDAKCLVSDLLYTDSCGSDKRTIESLSRMGVIEIISFDDNAMKDIFDLCNIYGNCVSPHDLFSIYIADVFDAKLITSEEICIEKCKIIGVQTTSKFDLLNYLELNKTG